MVVDGTGKPAAGPFDIVIENDIITQIAGYNPRDPNPRRPEKGNVEIDATGKYVLPGLINLRVSLLMADFRDQIRTLTFKFANVFAT